MTEIISAALRCGRRPKRFAYDVVAVCAGAIGAEVLLRTLEDLAENSSAAVETRIFTAAVVARLPGRSLARRKDYNYFIVVAI
jgi:hypothetical protein